MKQVRLRKSDLMRIYGVGERTIERRVNDGRLPDPDFVIGRTPYWRIRTIEQFEINLQNGKK